MLCDLCQTFDFAFGIGRGIDMHLLAEGLGQASAAVADLRVGVEGHGVEQQGKALEGRVSITLPDESIYRYEGIVGFTDPQVNPQTGTFAVRAIVPNPDKELLPGQYTRVKMPLEIRRGPKNNRRDVFWNRGESPPLTTPMPDSSSRRGSGVIGGDHPSGDRRGNGPISNHGSPLARQLL